MPSVSVIIPAYNCAAYLERSVQSVLNQSWNDWELIIVDDQSLDVTLLTAIEWGRSDARIRILQTAANSGPGAARNIGLQSAHGQWIAILDSDDWWDPRRLERLITFGSSHDADVILDDFWLHKPSGIPKTLTQLESDIHRLKGHQVSLYDVSSTSVAWMQPIVRRNFLGHHAIRWPNWRYSEDFGFLFELAWHGANIWVYPEALYHYHASRPDSLTQNSTRLFRGVYESAHHYAKLIKGEPSDRWSRQERVIVQAALKKRARTAYRMYILRKTLDVVVPSQVLRYKILEAYRRRRHKPD